MKPVLQLQLYVYWTEQTLGFLYVDVNEYMYWQTREKTTTNKHRYECILEIRPKKYSQFWTKWDQKFVWKFEIELKN